VDVVVPKSVYFWKTSTLMNVKSLKAKTFLATVDEFSTTEILALLISDI